MTEEERKIICSLDECNFTEIKEYSKQSFKKKAMAEKKRYVQLMITYGYCFMDGQKFDLGPNHLLL